ncbi:MAG: AMP-binding protein, partial [Kofleriaceae bacterium]
MATHDLIPRRLLQQAVDRPTAIAYQAKVNGQWQPTTWRTYVDQTRAAARALIGLGLAREGKVAILGFNRPEWAIFAHAAMLVGGVPAGIYTTCSAEEVHYIIDHSEATVALVENAAQLAKVMANRGELPKLKWIVMMRGEPVSGSAGADVLGWDELLAKAEATPDAVVDQRVDAIEPSDLAVLIYTSGTTGPAKGVMLSHANLIWTARALMDIC